MLPIGLRNRGISTRFVGNNKFAYSSLKDRVLESIVSSETYDIFYYPDDKETPDWTLFDKICKSYIKHYQESLDEPWAEKFFYQMVKQLKFLSVKYAQDIETKEIFAIGFFGAYIRNGATGECLTNAELYVMPEFRRKGIAKKLVGLTFDRALEKNIYEFDSVTYRLPNQDALSFWQSVGAEVSGLYHIEGNIEQMEQIISEKTGPRKK